MLGIVVVGMRSVIHQIPCRMVAVAVDLIVVAAERQARHPTAARSDVLLPAIAKAVIRVAESLRVLPIRTV